MFDQLFEEPRTLKRHRDGPLANERLQFLAYHAARGAVRTTLRRIDNFMLAIIEEMELQTTRKVSIGEIEAAADQRVFRDSRNGARKYGPTSRWWFIHVGQQWLAQLGRLRVPKARPVPSQDMLEEYTNYLRQEKGLSSYTIDVRSRQVARFLNHFYAKHRRIDEIRNEDIDRFIIKKGRQDGHARSTIKTFVISLRCFFRYAEMREWCSRGLAASILAPRVYKHELIPLGPSWSDVQKLIAGTVSDRRVDIRDRAILLFFSVYGLRSNEVLSLRLEDLNWEDEIIHVRRTKSRRTQTFPLSKTVGNALLRYLKEVRPRSPYREVFLTVKSPIAPLSLCVLYRMVAQRMRRLDLKLKHYGPKSLRHACATHLVAQGLSLKEIGDHLGHRSVEATRIYAKVDLDALRQVADLELGGLL